MSKGTCLSHFDFPAKQGKAYKRKHEQTASILAKFATSEANKTYRSKRLGLKVKGQNNDYGNGFTSEYLTGTLLGTASLTPSVSSASRFNSV